MFVYFIYLTLQSIAGRRVYAGILFDTPLWTGSGTFFFMGALSLFLWLSIVLMKGPKRSNQQNENFPEAIVSKNQSRA